MAQDFRRQAPWLIAWLAISLAGCALLARLEFNRLREAFDTDMRIVHRLLSQRVVQHDAILATLVLLQPAAQAQAEQRLPSLYPQVLGVRRRDSDGGAWPDGNQRAAEMLSRALRRPVLAEVDFARGRYQVLLAGEPSSFALELDLRAVVPWTEWPMAPQASPVRVTLEHESQTFVLQPGRIEPTGLGLAFHKHLAADSQPFDVAGARTIGIGYLPWGGMLAWCAAAAGALAALRALQRQRDRRRRAEELLRLGQVGRLNALGELAAGMAHELNNPLTAVLANAQAAARLLADDPPDLQTAREAMDQAAQQARRAADVVGRLRRAVEWPGTGEAARPVVLQEAVRNALYLLEPEFARAGISPQVAAPAQPVTVLADPVALEQIVHNLLTNALQALQQVEPAQRRLEVSLLQEPSRGVLAVADSGPGMAQDVLPRVFEPFFSTREGGLGLGLSLCETLAANMGGQLAAGHHVPRGAVFTLSLPLAAP